MEFLNSLTVNQWLLAGTVPLAVLVLYFLKLRRRPTAVASTYLWVKALEELHVNSLFQRLRRNLLLFLQLLAIALAMLALARLVTLGLTRAGRRHIILIDNSASMAATDAKPTRLEWAKQQARKLILEKMDAADKAMIIAFNDSAQIICSQTSNRTMLKERLAQIRQTARRTNVYEALSIASAQANPLKFIDIPGAAPETDLVHLHIFSDGRFPDVANIFLGNLEPHFYPVGDTDSNVAITTMQIRRSLDSPQQAHLFARCHNFSSAPAKLTCKLLFNGRLQDAQQAFVEPGGTHSLLFGLKELAEGVLKLEIEVDDAIEVDNAAWAVASLPRRARVLLVTAGNKWLQSALQTEAMRQIADVAIISPEQMKASDYTAKSEAGHYDLIIYDQASPPHAPNSNTLFLGILPPWLKLANAKRITAPVILSVNERHPLMRFVRMENVLVAEAEVGELPQGATALMESSAGPLAFLSPRSGLSDCIFSFVMLRRTDEGAEANTNWFASCGFPLFLFNSVRYLGGYETEGEAKSVQPGQVIRLRRPSLGSLRIRDPAGRLFALVRSPQGDFLFNETDQCGVYEVLGTRRGEPIYRFAVNLFDESESQILPRKEIRVGHTPVEAQSARRPIRREWWPLLVVLALLVLLLEWYVYNRRVHV